MKELRSESIETIQDHEIAIARLIRRSPESLAAFVGSLARDDGPIGEHVRTFIVGDDLVETVASLKERIASLRHSEHRYYRHRDGAQIGERLGYILDAIETLVLPAHPQQAFELLVLLVERDGDAMEQCADHYDTVQNAMRRAAGLMARAGESLPQRDVKVTLERLIAEDRYGARRPLVAVVEAFAP